MNVKIFINSIFTLFVMNAYLVLTKVTNFIIHVLFFLRGPNVCTDNPYYINFKS